MRSEWRPLVIHLCHLRGTGPWKVTGFNLMSLLLSSFTPTPEAPVHKGATNQNSTETFNLLRRIQDVKNNETRQNWIIYDSNLESSWSLQLFDCRNLYSCVSLQLCCGWLFP